MNKILYMLTSLSLILGINQELARLWSKYESAERADKPADMVAALEQIRSEAECKRQMDCGKVTDGLEAFIGKPQEGRRGFCPV